MFAGHVDLVTSIAFHPHNKNILASASRDCTIKVWEHGGCVSTLKGHSSAVQTVAFHPTQPAVLATGSDDTSIKMWAWRRRGDQQCLATLAGKLSVQHIQTRTFKHARACLACVACVACVLTINAFVN